MCNVHQKDLQAAEHVASLGLIKERRMESNGKPPKILSFVSLKKGITNVHSYIYFFFVC